MAQTTKVRVEYADGSEVLEVPGPAPLLGALNRVDAAQKRSGNYRRVVAVRIVEEVR